MRQISFMANYATEFSNFPQEKITRHYFKNVDDSIGPVIEEINRLRGQGYYQQAQRLIDNNSDVLSQYIVDATTFRTLEEEIYNTQIYARKKQQVIFFDTAEPDCDTDDVWIGGV